jgi:myb proto-oncogene protein
MGRKREDIQLKHGVQTHGAKNWAVIAILVPGRTKIQCNKRWKDLLDPSIALMAGKWSSVEDSRLHGALQLHSGNHKFRAGSGSNEKKTVL